ncbi:hypothetical protein K493DRAFT_316337 [Basidiobolus meristosporus CBS 931.73]|uniref:Gamma-secretase subunit PEN-2 n=1 Tax=Basidiobolus meristosporus CBS 931.73 TaxID=1314790 RepID=A0A1Y1Y551_9FUNG|nr:hypothetical protein K493DRAFT_316337 [Basidiobolus meristosporus CBS 931.73]|eukprot:ORX92856.1 hypothetical protein K493DRAFT_316337 [Basidiobolus meristosporus CBS 931.73]
MSSLDKLKNHEIVSISRKMFYGGFAFLPWLWLVNFIYFRPAINRADMNPVLRKYVYGSLVGASVWLAILVAWLSVFLIHRDSWNQLGEKLTVVIPKG